MFTHIFLDVDKTLTNSQKQISPRTFQALIDSQNKGYSISLCTGRQWALLTYMFKPLDFFPPTQQHIFSGGGQIITSDHQIIWQDLIPAATVSDIFNLAQQEQVLIFTTNNLEIIINQKEAAENFKKDHPVDPQTVSVATNYNQPLSLITCHHVTQSFLSQLSAHDIYYKIMHTYNNETYIDLTSYGVNKGTTIKNWAVLNHLSLNKLAMVGDSENDLEALQTVGHPFIMGNSVPEIKKFGFSQLGQTDQEGLAIWLESLPNLN